MRVVVVHNAVTVESPPDEQDVLVQVSAVQDVLKDLGHEVRTLPCNLDLSSLKRRLEAVQPDLVFNLVESLNGQGRLIHLFPALLDAMGLPYTGSQTEAVWFTSNKVLAKERMGLAGLPTPQWMGPYPRELPSFTPQKHPEGSNGSKCTWIIKSLWEHASVGLETGSIIKAESGDRVMKELERRAPLLGGDCFAETFIEGREFNLSILGGSQGPQVLPPAEIIFEGYRASQPRIVGYRAKWDEHSYEYGHTPRCFDFKPEERPLLGVLQTLAIQCWKVFSLRGYARVDFRVDEEGQPWILEVNANPCLSPDAGFAAAVLRAEMSLPQAIARILEDGITYRPPIPSVCPPSC